MNDSDSGACGDGPDGLKVKVGTYLHLFLSMFRLHVLDIYFSAVVGGSTILTQLLNSSKVIKLIYDMCLLLYRLYSYIYIIIVE